MLLKPASRSVLFAAILGALVVCLSGAASTQTLPDIAVIAHPDVGVASLTMADLRRILLGDREFWPSRTRVTLLIRAPVAHERDAAVKTVCEMTEAQFRQHWIGKVFRAESPSGPKIFYSRDMAIDQVSRIPGALALIEATPAPKGVKILTIDGKAPGQAGYRVK